MGDLNVSVFGAARESYMELLRMRLSPLIYQGLTALYEDSIKIEDAKQEFGGNYLKQFQTLLKGISKWNQSIIEEETQRIMNQMNYLMELVGAIFVSYVKILASVRMGGSDSSIKIKIPSADVFIHTIYKGVAESFYYNPWAFQNYNDRENHDSIMNIIDKSILNSVNFMIPIDCILKEYLSQVFSGSQHVQQNTGFNDGFGTKFKKIETMFEPENIFKSPSNDEFKVGDLSFKDDLSSVGSSSTNPFDDPVSSGILKPRSSLLRPKSPFSSSFGTDPFSAPASSNPFKTADPFSAPASSNPFKTSDPFSAPASSDPFKTSDPFSTPASSDLFKTPDPLPKDPFSSTIGSDPFKTADPLPKDPFSSSASDPFSSSKDPFSSSASSDPFSSSKDPFSSTKDPFRDDSSVKSEGGSFGSNNAPTPPELIDDIFAPKSNSVKFANEIP
jgi:hypothetical protein